VKIKNYEAPNCVNFSILWSPLPEISAVEIFFGNGDSGRETKLQPLHPHCYIFYHNLRTDAVLFTDRLHKWLLTYASVRAELSSVMAVAWPCRYSEPLEETTLQDVRCL